ncbi:MAG: tetratricopeptide repeat protein [Terrimicrobiaceae bacterium]
MIFPLALLLLASAPDNIAAAKSALEAGLPAVAINKLEGSPRPAKDAVLVLARAYLEDGKPGKAVDLLKSHPAGTVGDFWLAQSYAGLGRWEEALEMYRACRNEAAVSGEAVIGQARMLRNLGRCPEALAALEPAKGWPESPLRHLADFERAEALMELNRPQDAKLVLETVSPGDRREKVRRDYLMARSLSLSGDDSGALMLFDGVHPLDPDMAVGVVAGRARSLVRIGQPAIAETLLEDFLAKNPDLPGLEGVFSLLDSVYAAQTAASPSELKRWAEDGDVSPRKKLAGYYLARFEARLGRENRMEKLLENAVAGSAGNPALDVAFLELAQLRLKQGHPEEALKLLPAPGASAQADFLRGLALAALDDPAKASELFISASSDKSLAEVALYNAAVCDLFAGGTKSRGFNLLKERYPASPRLDGLRLRKGYELARRNDGDALGVFENLSKAGDGNLAAAANLALAEWEYENNDRQAALGHLRRVSASGAGEKDPQADALSVFLADDGRSDDAAIAAATKFLSAHEGAPAEPEVMMKLGELLYRKGDFAGARVRLESLAKKHPGTVMEFPALFLAAQSASHLQTPSAMNDAMLLFEEVASSKSPLAQRARFEQAVLQNVLGKPDEAIVILDQIIKSNGTPEIRSASLVEKGKTLYGLGGKDPKSYRAAIDVWRQVVGDPASTPSWRSQALARIGSAYENLGEPEAAVAAYYDVVKDGKLAPQAFFWFYKAGFAAARLLESSKRWDQAIKLYEMIAAVGGPRSEEATSRINQIRLENFLWDEPSGN